jgi:hypothetical protein
MPLGQVAFQLKVDEKGNITNITVYFSEPAPTDATWYKYNSVKGWQDFSEHAEFSSDMKSIVLRLEDGGSGDVDVTANGIIADPSGMVSLTSANEGSNNSSGTGCFTEGTRSWVYFENICA